MGRFKLTEVKFKDLTPIILVMLLLFVSTACANMLIPSYAAIQQEFDIPQALIAIPDAFFVLISAIFALLWGYWADRVDRGKVLLVGALSWTIGMLLTYFSGSYFMLIISRILSGAGLGCVLPIGYSVISDAIPAEERSGWFGFLAILSSISNGAGQGLSSFLGPIFSWRFPFLLLSVISVIVMILLLFVKIPTRGAGEDELLELIELDLEYSFRISREDLGVIIRKKTNKYLIIQGFFLIIPGTVLVYFMTSMLTLSYFDQIPSEIRLQTATIFAGMIGIGYILGNAVLARLGDALFRRNKKNRARLATICLVFSIPFAIILLISLKPIDPSMLNIEYPTSIPTEQIFLYMIRTIGEIFVAYPSYIVFFIFALIASMLGAGPVANRNAIMIDVNMPEHKGTAASFFKLSEQISKGVMLLVSYTLISILGSIFNMIFISIFFWIPAAILWFGASRNVEKDMDYKTRILSERKQISLIDYIFELEIQIDRAIQKVQDSKYYIQTDQQKFNKLINDALIIFKFCEREGESRSITNIEKKGHIMYLRVQLVKQEVINIYAQLNHNSLSTSQKEQLIDELNQIFYKIDNWEKSTFGEIQTYYEDAYLKIIEARLNSTKHLIKGKGKINEAIRIYERVKYLLNERLEIVEENPKPSEEETIARDKELELFEKCSKALNATIKLDEEVENAFKHLKEEGIHMEDLRKISDLTQEYDINIYNVIVDTFQGDKKTKKILIQTIKSIEDIFNQYEEWRETDFTVF